MLQIETGINITVVRENFHTNIPVCTSCDAQLYITLHYILHTLGSWHEFGCHDDANAWRKSTKEVDNTQNFLLQFREKNSLHALASLRQELTPKI